MKRLRISISDNHGFEREHRGRTREGIDCLGGFQLTIRKTSLARAPLRSIKEDDSILVLILTTYSMQRLEQVNQLALSDSIDAIQFVDKRVKPPPCVESLLCLRSPTQIDRWRERKLVASARAPCAASSLDLPLLPVTILIANLQVREEDLLNHGMVRTSREKKKERRRGREGST